MARDTTTALADKSEELTAITSTTAQDVNWVESKGKESTTPLEARSDASMLKGSTAHQELRWGASMETGSMMALVDKLDAPMV